jgi:Winged helix-turn helix/Peptidase A4 family
MAEPVRARRRTDQEGQRLQQIVRRGKHGSVRMRRAMIIMASASGTLVPAIARLVAADEDTVRDVIHLFNAKGLAALEPGSLVKGTVIYDGEGKYSLNLAVTTNHGTLRASTEQLCTYVCENMSAEWVVEKVRLYDMADFTAWDLTDGEATTAANPGEQTVASFKPMRRIINTDRYLRAVPLALDGSSFVVATEPAPGS